MSISIRNSIHRLVGKALDRSRSPSPSPSKSRWRSPDSPKVSGEIERSLGPGHKSLKENLKENNRVVRHKSLSKSVGELLDLLELVDTGVGGPIMIKLDGELKNLSDTLGSVPSDDDDSSPDLGVRIDTLASDINSASRKARARATQGRFTGTLADLMTLTSLTNDLDAARKTFLTKLPVDTPLHDVSSARTMSDPGLMNIGIVEEPLDLVEDSVEGPEGIDISADKDQHVANLINHIERVVKMTTQSAAGASTSTRDEGSDDLRSEIEAITSEAEKLRQLTGFSERASILLDLNETVSRAFDRLQEIENHQMQAGIRGRTGGNGADMRLNIGQLGESSRRNDQDTNGPNEGTEMLEMDSNPEEGKALGQVDTESVEENQGDGESDVESNESTELTTDERKSLETIHPRVEDADYNSALPHAYPFCMPSTRVEILGRISRWVTDSARRPMFWLVGRPGVGKSTIARTVARDLDDKGLLGASFFFSHEEENRRTLRFLFPSIAYQLAHAVPAFRNEIASAADPYVSYSTLRIQLEKLIVNPLKASTKRRRSPVVVILDGLDECTNVNHVIEMIILLSSALQELRPRVNLKIMVTSRHEVHLRWRCRNPGLSGAADIFELHDVDNSLSDSDDIQKYLDYHLAVIKNEEFSADETWPPEGSLKVLARMAEGLFSFASTAISYIRNRPHENMDILLAGSGSQKTLYPFRYLDFLYRQALLPYEPNSPEGYSEEVIQTLHNVLGAVAVMMEPLPIRSLESFLQLDEGTVNLQLPPLHMVLSVLEPPHPVRVIHSSFSDFLKDSQRCGSDSWFYIDQKRHHSQIALLCFDHMNTFLNWHSCIVNIAESSVIGNDEEKVNDRVPTHISYACQHWASQLSGAEHSNELDDAINQFCSTKFLFWVEILKRTKGFGNCIDSLNKAKEWCKRHKAASQPLINEFYGLLLRFREELSRVTFNTLDLIPSASESNTGLLSMISRELEERRREGSAETEVEPSPSFMVLRHHTDFVATIAYSPDGSQVAIGSNDKTITIWGAKTGTLLRTLKGHHSNCVKALAFSPDGTRIVSGSYDKSAIIWDFEQGVLSRRLNKHTYSITSVAFSPDGMFVASGSNDCKICIWDASTGYYMKTLEGHTDCVRAVTFSPDGTQIASGSNDETVAIWDVVSGELIGTLADVHTDCVTSVAFTPDGATIASGSDDKTIAIWDSQTETLLRILEGHSDQITSIAFSPDGARIASSSNDGNTLIFDVESGIIIRKLKGGTSSARAVAFSPDGAQLASGTYDNTVTLWDIPFSWVG